jgi:hypothetical protein
VIRKYNKRMCLGYLNNDEIYELYRSLNAVKVSGWIPEGHMGWTSGSGGEGEESLGKSHLGDPEEYLNTK